MRARIGDTWQNIISGLWFLPAVLVLAGVVLAELALRLDMTFAEVFEAVPFLFAGTSDTARSLLSTVAGTLATVLALLFSVMIVALTQASGQFSPRLLRNFMSNHTDQLVLGSYVGTVTYAFLVLRQIRSPDEGVSEFIPTLAASIAIVLTLYCLGLLVLFFHQSAQLLQVSTVLQNAHAEVSRTIDRLYPQNDSAPPEEPPAWPEPDPPEPSDFIRARSAWFLRSIDINQLLGAAVPELRELRVVPRVGAYVPRRSVLADVWLDGPRELDTRTARRIEEAFVIGREQTVRQDILFGLRQMVDIALRSLSPGVQDPTTAEYALSHLGDVVGTLATRRFPPHVLEVGERPALFYFDWPSFDDVVAGAFAQVRRAAAADPHVTGHLLDVLATIQEHTRSDAHMEPLRQQARTVLESMDGHFTRSDEERLRRLAEAVIRGDRSVAR